MQDAVAEETLVCERPSGERVISIAAIGRPHQIGPGHWACPVSLTGLYGRLADAHGVSSLQALCLAASLQRQLLEAFANDGGRLFFSDGESPLDLDACFLRVGERSG